jgi:hypothetical protein
MFAMLQAKLIQHGGQELRVHISHDRAILANNRSGCKYTQVTNAVAYHPNV